ncbi:hypothetical protein RCL99_06440, partial [Escherichia coli]|nr:hypothetical protein [Escherichia coli]
LLKKRKINENFVELFSSPSVLLPVFYNSVTWSRFGCISVFFSFKNEFFLFPINQIKRAVYFGVITGLTAWVGIVFSKLIARYKSRKTPPDSE